MVAADFPENDAAPAADSALPDPLLETIEFFGPESPLRRAALLGGRSYEERPQQRAMAETVAECLVHGDHLLVEAPTGVGKSFAYLVPAILFAHATGKPVVISTHTIALQEQLLQKDVPLLAGLIEREFQAALGKGREHYLCVHRLKRVLGNQEQYLPLDELLPEIRRISAWAESTEDGSLADLDFTPSNQTWALLCAEPGACPAGADKEGSGHRCFLRQARQKLHQANIIVVNHALLCVDLELRRESEGQQSILPDYAALIVDEAHTFADVAANHLGLRFSSQGLAALLLRLYNPRHNRGLLLRPEAESARQAARQAFEKASGFFGRLQLWLEQQDENPLVFNSPGHIPNVLGEPLGRLRAALRDLVQDSEIEADFRTELKPFIERLDHFIERLHAFLEMTVADSVYWFERGGRQGQNIGFNVAPVEVDRVLRQELFNRPVPVVMTSATLAVRGDLEYFRAQVGAEHARTLILDSPFNFREQVDLYLAQGTNPDPRSGEPWTEYVLDKIQHFILMTRGKAFVLFTSYQMMNLAADRLAGFFERQGIRLMVQGRDLTRSRMLQIFREDIDSTIFGTDSFWTGVDVPGEALSNVIIVKLPFPVPSHPLLAARSRLLEQRGGNSFRDYLLPEAILKFRQGFGRLIRTRDDKGIIVVLDPRMMHASYGRDFLRSVPPCKEHLF